MFYKNLLLFACIALSGCGFSPMNKLSDNLMTTDKTSQISISNIPNYEGYLLKQQLEDNLNPQKTSVQKKYILTVYLKAPTYTDQSIQGDNFASRETTRIHAKYQLKEIETGEIILQDTTSATGAYNIVKEPYATNIAKNKLKENLIQIISDNITVRLVSFFKTKEDISESKTDTN